MFATNSCKNAAISFAMSACMNSVSNQMFIKFHTGEFTDICRHIPTWLKSDNNTLYIKTYLCTEIGSMWLDSYLQQVNIKTDMVCKRVYVYNIPLIFCLVSSQGSGSLERWICIPHTPQIIHSSEANNVLSPRCEFSNSENGENGAAVIPHSCI